MRDFRYIYTHTQRAMRGPARLSSGSAIQGFFCIWTESAVSEGIRVWAPGAGFISSTLWASDFRVF